MSRLRRGARFVLWSAAAALSAAGEALLAQVPAASFFTLAPCRAVDTRDAEGPYGGPSLASGETRTFVLANRCGIPPGAVAVALNVTVASPGASGSLTLFPAGGPPPGTGTLAFAPGRTRAGSAVLGLSAAGALSVHGAFVSGRTHVVVDVSGYFAAAPAYPWPVWSPANVAVPPSATGRTFYVDGASGSDARDGRSVPDAFRTIAHAVSLVAPGDTVLILAGLYREGIDLVSAPSGTASAPITFGSYGNGEVILDGSTKVTGWTRHAGNVWKAGVSSFVPAAVVVNETPLREVSHGQTTTAPPVGLAGVTGGSGAWFFDDAAHVLYADMETTLGTGDPATADVVVPGADGAQAHLFFYGDWYVFAGLTIRGSGAAGVWGYGSHVTVERCDIKFNGKGAVSFQGPAGAVDDAVIASHAYHNVLLNWPRGNNDFVGGGWPSALGWYANLRPLARGNVVHRNGGEGILTYGTEAGAASGSALFEQNVVFDNWSVNVYVDNQPDAVIRSNLVFDHPADLGDLLYQGDPYWTEDLSRKLTPVGVMLADEEWSSDATNHHANLANTAVYDNVLAGNRVGIRDYAEGPEAEAWHGLKNTLIAHNTIVLPSAPGPDYSAGIEIGDNRTPSGVNRNSGSTIANNVVVGSGAGYLVWSREGTSLAGVAIDHDVYDSGAPTPFALGPGPSLLGFAGWKAGNPGREAASLFADPLLAAAGLLGAPPRGTCDWRHARPAAASPVRDAGQALAPPVPFDFALAPRPQGAAPDAGAFELAP